MEELLLTAKKFEVKRRRVTMPSGRVADWDIICHPGAVVVLPVLDDGSVVLIHNYRPSVGQTLLELPAGTLEADEQPEACAAREVEEETGYRARVIEPFAEFYTSPGILSERMYVFVARGLTQVGQKLDEHEEITVETYAPDKIRQMLVQGKVMDGKTIAVLATYFLRAES